MNIVFVEPRFPDTQRQFVRALRAVGAHVMVISEYAYDDYDDELKSWIDWHHQIHSVTDEAALEWAVRQAQRHTWVDRLECTIESHVLPTARVRERCGIPGTSARAAYLCRDKPTQKQVLREAGIPTAASTAARVHRRCPGLRPVSRLPDHPQAPRLPPGRRGPYGWMTTTNCVRRASTAGVDDGASVALEEFVEGHEGFFDTVTIHGRVVHEFASHYFPNVLEAMRTRWISPQIIATNRVREPEYEQVREMGRRVIDVLGLDTSATHMEWFFGPKGLKFSEIGARPPGVGQWDMYNEANEMDLHHEWAHALMFGQPSHQPSYRYSCGLIALRPNRDGIISGYSGLEAVAAALRSHDHRRALPTPRHCDAIRRGWLPRECMDAAPARGLRHAQGGPLRYRAHGSGLG